MYFSKSYEFCKDSDDKIVKWIDVTLVIKNIVTYIQEEAHLKDVSFIAKIKYLICQHNLKIPIMVILNYLNKLQSTIHNEIYYAIDIIK